MKRGLEEAVDPAEGKRARREGIDMAGNDVEEFFAVLKRIEATKKELGCISMADKKNPFLAPTVEAVTSKPPWRLSFEWEDFCSSNGNRSGDLIQASASVDTNANFKQGKQLKDDDDNKKQFVCLKQNNNDEEGTERLDLNLPAKSAGFHLFF